ncbi:MAG: dienelactone hydrolase family protein [Verrucomicrobiota bacterium]
MRISLCLVLASVLNLKAQFERVTVDYELDGTSFRGHLVYHEGAEKQSPVPAILMVPNWMGPDKESTLKKAMEVASDEFAVFIVDMYGTEVRPSNGQEAGAAAGFVRADRSLMRARAQKAVDVFKELSEAHPVDTDNMIGIGFCFGGGTLLEYARTGSEDLDGIVSFHGDLVSPTLEADASQVKTPILVLHGADDPYVPQQHVQTFVAAMQAGDVDDWQLIQFSGAVHSFTDPTAQSEGARYHARTSERAFELMEDFAEEVLDLED